MKYLISVLLTFCLSAAAAEHEVEEAVIESATHLTPKPLSAPEAPVNFDAAKWKQVKKAKGRQGINVHTGKVENEKLKAFKGDTQYPYPVLSLIAVMMDLDHFTEWVYKLKAVKREQHTNQPKYFLMSFKRIWPTKPRDVGIESRVVHNLETGVVELYSIANGDEVYPKQKGYVRIPRLYNRWVLTPMEDGWTHAEFETFVDPGGKIPRWIINLVSESAPKRTLAGLRKQLNTERYNISSAKELPFVPEGLYFD